MYNASNSRLNISISSKMNQLPFKNSEIWNTPWRHFTEPKKATAVGLIYVSTGALFAILKVSVTELFGQE